VSLSAPSPGHPLKCRCGNVRGLLAKPRNANRVICYCKDCQAFAHVLGDAQATLGPRGGSDIIQVLPKDLVFTQGSDALACLRLTPKGLLRWYTSCCRTPIGNTLATAKVSFVGLLHDSLETEGILLDESFGPVRARVNTRGAWGAPKPKEVGRGKVAAWFIRTTLKARLNGDYKRSPFFQPMSGTPVVIPRVLGQDELLRVRQTVQAASAD
jgi:hypothetical protein